MKAVALVRKAYAWGPLLFGVGFIAPVVAQSLDAAPASAPPGLSNLQLGLAVGFTMGAVAQLRGRWL
jgi:hypothetical protein